MIELIINFFASLSDPVITVLLGSITYVVGILLVKALIDPYRDVQQLRGEIASDIYFYNEYLSNDDGGEEIRQEIKNAFRSHASELNGQIKRYALLKYITKLHTIPSLDQLKDARKELIRLSNMAKFEDSDVFNKSEAVQRIEENLELQEDSK